MDLIHGLLYLFFMFKGTPSAFLLTCFSGRYEKHMFFYIRMDCMFLQFIPAIVYSSVSELGSRSGGRGRGGWRRFRGRGECNLQHSGSLFFNQFHMVPPSCHQCAVGGTVQVLTSLSLLADPIPIRLVFAFHVDPILTCLSKALLSIKSFSIGRARGRERERANHRIFCNVDLYYKAHLHQSMRIAQIWLNPSILSDRLYQHIFCMLISVSYMIILHIILKDARPKHTFPLFLYCI